jgi:hypothetical protein
VEDRHALTLAVSALGQDKTDHPPVSSYPGSRIASHRQLEFEPYEVVVSPNKDGTPRFSRITKTR